MLMMLKWDEKGGRLGMYSIYLYCGEQKNRERMRKRERERRMRSRGGGREKENKNKKQKTKNTLRTRIINPQPGSPAQESSPSSGFPSYFSSLYLPTPT